MPTNTVSSTTVDIADIVKAMGVGTEHIARIANDALTDMLVEKVAMRDALLPAYNEYRDGEMSANPKRGDDWTPAAKDVNAYLAGLARGAKLRWTYSEDDIRELLYKLDAHDDAAVATYVLWCVDGQGKYEQGPRKGENRPAKTPNYDGYLAWLPTKGNYTKAGIETSAAKATRLANQQAAEANALRQMTTTNYVDDFMAGADLKDRVNQMLRHAHDIERAIAIIESKADEDQLKAIRQAKRDFNKAVKGS